LSFDFDFVQGACLAPLSSLLVTIGHSQLVTTIWSQQVGHSQAFAHSNLVTVSWSQLDKAIGHSIFGEMP